LVVQFTSTLGGKRANNGGLQKKEVKERRRTRNVIRVWGRGKNRKKTGKKKGDSRENPDHSKKEFRADI